MTTVAVRPLGWLSYALQLFLGYFILRPWFAFVVRGRIRRSRQVPDGPCVLACNHRSYGDPPLVGMCMRHPIAYFARANLWDSPIIAFFLNTMASIPVDRANPGMSSMKGAVERLRQGVSVLVFPEGTRTKNGCLGPLRDGPALFARRAGVPLVPVYLFRSEATWPRGSIVPRFFAQRVEIRLGAPIVPPAGLDARAQDAWVSRRLHAWMVAQERVLQERPGRMRLPA